MTMAGGAPAIVTCFSVFNERFASYLLSIQFVS
jgi:hypothetical protein